MADIPTGADARVVITIDVNDAQANAKLAAMGQRLRALDKDAKTSSKSFDTVSDKLDDVSRGATRSSKSLKDMGDGMTRMTRAMRAFSQNAQSVGRALSVMGSAFGALFKIVAVGAIEFGLLTAAVGAFKLALVSAQYIAKAWTGIVQGVGAAAGVAVAGIASVFAAIRELQVAQMAPMYSGPATARGDIGRILGSRQLAVFDQQSLQGIIQQQLASTGRVDAQFQQRLTRLANFTGGDAKSLQNLNQLFNDMQKSGKVTADLYAQLQSASPGLAKAFQEMAGGEKQAVAAAASGSITFQRFFDTIMKGDLEALQPYNDALERLNDTLIGRLKGSLITIREQFTEVGMTMLDSLKGPIAEVEESFSNFLFAVTPTLQRVFPRLIGDAFGAGSNVLDRFLMRVAVLVNENMPKLIGFGSTLRDVWNGFKDALQVVGAYLDRMSAGWSTVWSTILKPFFSELGKTFNFALDEFNRLIANNASELENMGKMLSGVFEVFRGFIASLSVAKEILQPVMQGLMRILSVIGGALSGDNLFGAFMRVGVALGVVGLAFMKVGRSLAGFISSVMSGKSSLQNLISKQSQAAATANTNSVAQNQQQSELVQTATAANSAAAAINNLTSAQVRNAAVAAGSPALAARWDPRNPTGTVSNPGPTYGGPMAGGYAWSAGQAAMFGPGPRELAQARARRLSMWAPERNALRGALLAQATGMTGGPRAAYDAQLMQSAIANSGGLATSSGPGMFGRAGSAMAKAFTNDAVKKYGVGAGMASTFVGALIQGSSAPTSTTGQTLGGALAGAGTGAMIGSMFGPAGTVVGGLVGGLAGGLSGFFGSQAAQEREREEERQRLQERLDSIRSTGGLFNRGSDFSRTRAAYEQQLSLLFDARSAASQARNTSFQSSMASKVAPFLAGLGIDVRDGNFFASGTDRMIDNPFLGQGAAAEDFLVGLGFERGAVAESIARYGVQGAFAEIADIDLTNLEEAATNLDELSGNLGEFDESISAVLTEMNKLSGEQLRYTGNLESAQRILGMSSGGVISLFDRLNMSIAESGVNIDILNEALGYTGDVITDLGVATARLRDALFDPVNTLRTEAEMDDRLRSQLTSFFETRGNESLSTNDMKTLAADTVGAYVDSQLAKVAAGEVSFADMFGSGGDFMGGFNELWDQAIAGGVPIELRGMVTDLIAAMAPTFQEALVDPFKRMQYDPEFAAGFTKQIDAITGGAYGLIKSGRSPEEVIAQGTDKLVTFLEESGFEITDQTMIDLDNLLSNSILDSAAGISAAFDEGSTMVYDRIVAALTGKSMPGQAPPGYGRERGYNFPSAVAPNTTTGASTTSVRGDTYIDINIPSNMSPAEIRKIVEEAIADEERDRNERSINGALVR